MKPEIPPHGSHLLAELLEGGRVLSLILNRPKQMNTMTDELEADLCKLLDYFERTPSIWVCIVSGRSEPGQRVKVFCAGQDLKDWLESSRRTPHVSQADRMFWNPHGFGSLSRRHSRKPIIAAVDGVCLGGGLEIITNCDLVVATAQSVFGFPEVQRGVVAAQGGIPRLALLCGHALASELLLLGRSINAQQACERYRIVNKVVPTSEDLMPAALAYARTIISNSPSAVQVTKLSLLEGSRQEAQASPFPLTEAQKRRLEPFGHGVEAATMASVLRSESSDLYSGSDFREGLAAFKEKRQPQWRDPPPPPKAKL